MYISKQLLFVEQDTREMLRYALAVSPQHLASETEKLLGFAITNETEIDTFVRSGIKINILNLLDNCTTDFDSLQASNVVMVD